MGTASNNGKMAALLGLDLQKAQAVCDEASSKGIVELANLNCPGQIVIGGEAQAVTYACEIAKNHGAKRALVLPVSGAIPYVFIKRNSSNFWAITRIKRVKRTSNPNCF